MTKPMFEFKMRPFARVWHHTFGRVDQRPVDMTTQIAAAIENHPVEYRICVPEAPECDSSSRTSSHLQGRPPESSATILMMMMMMTMMLMVVMMMMTLMMVLMMVALAEIPDV